jgi:ketosteroid isomerase-like protein
MTEHSAELVELELAWASAFQANDRETLERLLAPEFRLSFVTDPRAPDVISRESWFSTLDRMTFASFEIHSTKAVVFDDVAVIHAHLSLHGWRFDGNLLPSEYKVTDVCVRREGAWKVVQRISAPTAEAPEFGSS